MKLTRRRVEERSSNVDTESTEIIRNNQHKDCNDARFGLVLRDKGNEAMRNGQVQMAVQFYSQALRHEVTVPLLCHRADAYMKLALFDDAIHDCSKIIRLQPKVWRAYALRAAAFRERGRFAEAMADLKQAKELCPKRSTHLEKLRTRCRQDWEKIKRAQNHNGLVEAGSKLPPRPFVKGDKRITSAHLLIRVRDCFRVITRVLEEPHSAGAIIWKADELDCWRRVRMRNQKPTMKKPKQEENKDLDIDTMVIVQRLKELLCFLQEGGQEMRQMLGHGSSFSTLLEVYDHQDLLVFEILNEALQDGDDINIRAFLQAQPFPILAQSLQDPRQPMRSIACALLDMIASLKAQQILTFLMHENLIPALMKSMHLGSVTEQASSVSLFLKLALDPRLGRYLSSCSSLEDLCSGLARACRAGKQITRIHGAQAITTLLGYEKMRENESFEASRAVLPLGVSIEEPCDFNESSLCSVFANGGVLKAVTSLLARESQQAPETAATSSSIWEEDVELICEEITTNVTDFSEVHECILRDFNLLSGYGHILVLNAIRAMDFMADASNAIEVLDQANAWGLFIALLSSFPNELAAFSAKTLAKFCLKSRKVAMHIADLWPVNSSLIVLELARSAHRSGDSNTYQTGILILAELAGCKSFLASMQKPTSFSALIDFLQDGKSSTITLKCICTCLAVAVTSCEICVEFAQMKAYVLGSRLLQLWCEYRVETHLRWQVENLMFILMDKSFVLQQAILCLLENRNPSSYRTGSQGKIMAPYNKQISSCLHSSSSSPRVDEDAAERYMSFSQNRTNFQEVCFFLSTLVHPSTKFADLCAGAGLMSIQVAKHFKEIHCYAVTRKRTWVEHTRRIAKHEAVLNLTAVLSKSLDHLPNTLPGSLDVAILCLSLDVVQDYGRLFCSVRAKLQQQGKLVLIDDNEQMMIEAKMQAASYGLDVVHQSTMAQHYLLLVLQRTNEL
ncbi:unnamed protein product [Calypogeia fissa]